MTLSEYRTTLYPNYCTDSRWWSWSPWSPTRRWRRCTRSWWLKRKWGWRRSTSRRTRNIWLLSLLCFSVPKYWLKHTEIMLTFSFRAKYYVVCINSKNNKNIEIQLFIIIRNYWCKTVGPRQSPEPEWVGVMIVGLSGALYLYIKHWWIVILGNPSK